MTATYPETPATVLGASLHFVDADGTSWRITERDCRGVPGAHAARCLVFMSESVFRRIWEFPADWRSLSGDELALLSWRR
jgi:hypothetical protein